MTFIRKFNGRTERPPSSDPIVATYTCPEHGEFDAEVRRDENGEAPDVTACAVNTCVYLSCGLPSHGQGRCDVCGHHGMVHGEGKCHAMTDWVGEVPPPEAYCKCAGFMKACGRPALWTPSPVAGRVRRIEAVKGKWEPPARPTYLDTRELGEGMDMEDFQAKRAAVWEKKRQEDVMAVKKGFG